MPEIIDYDFPPYKRRWEASGPNRWNGAYYYAQEIRRDIIPQVKTDRNWILVNQMTFGFDHSICFAHNNLQPDRYSWLKEYRDVVLVVGVPQTVEKVKSYAKHVVYLPLSIDVEDVKKYKLPKEERQGTCFIGRPEKAFGFAFPEGTAILTGMPREELLKEVAKYERAYAVGRCALEAKCLGLEILPYDPRYPDPSLWKVSDTSTAIRRLQRILDDIDG